LGAENGIADITAPFHWLPITDKSRAWSSGFPKELNRPRRIGF